MAKVKGPLHSDSASGQTRGDITFRTHRGIQIIRKSGKKYNPNTAGQKIARGWLTSAIAHWQSLEEKYKNSWNQAAEGKDQSGYNLHNGEAIKALKAGQPMPKWPPWGPPPYTFFEDFDDGVADGWTPLDGTWEVEADNSAPSLPNAYSAEGESTAHSNASIFEDNQTDYIMSVNFEVQGGSLGFYYPYFGVYLRYVNADNWVRVDLHSNKYMRLVRMIEGSQTIIGSATIPYYDETTGWHLLEITDAETEVTVVLDGTTYIDGASYGTGVSAENKGLLCYEKTHVHFDNVGIP